MREKKREKRRQVVYKKVEQNKIERRVEVNLTIEIIPQHIELLKDLIGLIERILIGTVHDQNSETAQFLR